MKKKYRQYENAVALVKYQFVFITRRHKKVLSGDVETRLRELLRLNCTELNVEILGLEVMPDHVHLHVAAPPSLAPLQIMFRVKSATAKVLRIEFEHLKRLPSMFTTGFFVSTEEIVSRKDIEWYVANEVST